MVIWHCITFELDLVIIRKAFLERDILITFVVVIAVVVVIIVIQF